MGRPILDWSPINLSDPRRVFATGVNVAGPWADAVAFEGCGVSLADKVGGARLRMLLRMRLSNTATRHRAITLPPPPQSTAPPHTHPYARRFHQRPVSLVPRPGPTCSAQTYGHPPPPTCQVNAFLVSERLRLRAEIWDRSVDQEFLLLGQQGQQGQALAPGRPGPAPGAAAGALGLVPAGGAAGVGSGAQARGPAASSAAAAAAGHGQGQGVGDFQRKMTPGAVAALVGAPARGPSAAAGGAPAQRGRGEGEGDGWAALQRLGLAALTEAAEERPAEGPDGESR